MKRIATFALAAIALGFVFSCATAPAKGISAIPSEVPTPSEPLAAEPAAGPAISEQPAAAPVTTAASDIPDGLKPYSAMSNAGMAAVRKAETLAAAGKWKSAFQAVDEFDSANADPFALAMKTSLVLRGSVRSDMDNAFGLVDLEDGDDLETLRSNPGDYEMMPFDPPALAEAQLAKGIEVPGILSKELGDYYSDVMARFAGQWTSSDDNVLAKIAENYSKALYQSVYDEISLLNYAQSLSRLNRVGESNSIYQKAIGFYPQNAVAYGNYAANLVTQGKKAEALALLDAGLAACVGSPDRISLIALGANTAAGMADEAKLASYYTMADEENPDSPMPGMLRHSISVGTGRKEAAIAAADSLVPDYGGDPTVIRTLVSTWYSAGQADVARDFLQRNIATTNDDMTIGALSFYLGMLIAQDVPSEADRVLALKALSDAEIHLRVVLGEETPVFGIIAEIRSSLEGPGAAANNADAPAQ